MFLSDVNWGTSTQAQTYKQALMAVHNLIRVEDHVKNFRPQLLVLTGMTSARPSLIDFAHLITKNLSLLVCGNIIKVCLFTLFNELKLFTLIYI